MNQFYSSNITDSIAVLSESESQHLRVLRIKEGEQLVIVDGVGNQYLGELSKFHKKASEVLIQETIKQIDHPPSLDIAIAPTKSNDRYEWFLEKATEIGVRNIYPFISYHSERKVIKGERMEKVILSAMKQSLRLWLPQLKPMVSFKGLIDQCKTSDDAKYMAHLKTDQRHFKDQVKPNQPALILIGPEGGFSDVEIAMAESANFESVTLGASRLRTETAGVVAATIFNNQ